MTVFDVKALLIAFLSLCFDVAESKLDLISLRNKVNWKRTDGQ